jgi:hypothetical protein
MKQFIFLAMGGSHGNNLMNCSVVKKMRKKRKREIYQRNTEKHRERWLFRNKIYENQTLQYNE